MSRTKLTPPFRWFLILIPIAIISAIILCQQPSPPANTPPAKAPTPAPTSLADLALPPDWTQLDRFQKTISLKTFLRRLKTIYTKDDSWEKWITLDPKKNLALIGDFTLHFSDLDQSPPGAIYDWQTLQDLSTNRELPLQGLHIALDPGHIGGDFAKIEQREYTWLKASIREGTMTLRTAEILKPLLEDLGARVSLVRTKLEPVTAKRSNDFPDPRLFYRTSEIRARANLINQTLHPDLVICLHFNGTASKFPELHQHFHIILNGTYTAGELAHEDERFQMLQRILSGVIEEEIPIAHTIATTFNEHIKLPVYRYSSESRTSQNIDNNPNLWARNLLANRLYQCPVIFMEPYVMNSAPFILRFNNNREAIYQEYAQAVADGLARYYSQK